MSPFIHGRIYPETESSRLLAHSLRIFVDPRDIREHQRLILEIDTLRLYLRDIDSPCRINLMLPAQTGDELEAEYRFMRALGSDVLPSASIITAEAAAAFPDTGTVPEALALASTALIGEADLVFSERLAQNEEIVKRFDRLHIALLPARGVRLNCEVFARGHEVPWSFTLPAWRMPWNAFYPMVDGDIQTLEQLRGLAIRKGVAADVHEHIRSLGLNRWSAIAYTRDKLLFYVIQRHRAKRENLEKQDFTFELAYHLNTYFLLFWGALDQVS